jgi:hypothetical protein
MRYLIVKHGLQCEVVDGGITVERFTATDALAVAKKAKDLGLNVKLYGFLSDLDAKRVRASAEDQKVRIIE